MGTIIITVMSAIVYGAIVVVLGCAVILAGRRNPEEQAQEDAEQMAYLTARKGSSWIERRLKL